MRIITEVHVAQALSRSYSHATSILLKRIEGDFWRIINNIGVTNRGLLRRAVSQLSLKMKLYLLKRGSFLHGMDEMITAIMHDKEVRQEIRKEFGPAKAKLILNPLFIRALTYHLSIHPNIFNQLGFGDSIELWESFSEPERTFSLLVRDSFVEIIKRHFPGHGVQPHLHSEYGYTEMTRLRYEGREIFPEAYDGLYYHDNGFFSGHLTILLQRSLWRDDFVLYATVLQNLITIKELVEEQLPGYKVAGYTTPCFLDPKYCEMILESSFKKSHNLIPTLEAFQKIAEDHPVKKLIYNWFNHDVSPEQLAYAKKIYENHANYETLFDNKELNRLVMCIVGQLIDQQQYEYRPINKVSQKVRETIRPLFPEPLTQLIGFLAEGNITTKKEENKEDASKEGTAKQSDAKEDVSKEGAKMGVKEGTKETPLKRPADKNEEYKEDGDDVLIEMDEKKEDRMDYMQRYSYCKTSINFILEKIKPYLESTKGIFSSWVNSSARSLLQPLERIIPTLAKQSEKDEVSAESDLLSLQLCLALLINPQAQKIDAIANLANVYCQWIVGQELSIFLKSDDKGDKELRNAIRQDVIDQMKSILKENEMSCDENLSVANIINALEASLNKKPKEEIETLESQLSL